MRNQCRARPSLQALGWTLSLLGGGMGMGGGVEATPPSRRVRMQQRQHKDGGGRRAKKVESQVKKPKGHPGTQWAGSSLQVVRCWESPQPHSSPETKAGGCKVWQFGLQVLVSIHHPGQPLASPGLCASAPWGKKKAILPATSVCLGHHKGACNMGPLVPEAGGGGVEGWRSRGTCPQAGRGWGGILRTGERGQWEGIRSRNDSC